MALLADYELSASPPWPGQASDSVEFGQAIGKQLTGWPARLLRRWLLASAREVIENPTDDIGIFDAGDDVHGMDCSYNPFAFPTSL
jgi:hypothetical protein